MQKYLNVCLFSFHTKTTELIVMKFDIDFR